MGRVYVSGKGSTMGEVKRINLKKEGATGGIEVASVVVHEEKYSFAINMTKEAGVNPFIWADIVGDLVWEVAEAYAAVTGGVYTTESLLKEMRKHLDDNLDRRTKADQREGLDHE